jgi:hypothetical protein
MSRKSIPFDELRACDLHIDALYEGGSKGNTSDDPIDPLLGVGNQGGFRYIGSAKEGTVRLCVLYSDFVDPDWPDELVCETGRLTYYGDNKRPGHDLHDTPRNGNLVLLRAFEYTHSGNRVAVPPFFVFQKAGVGRGVLFRGIAVPGGPGVGQTEDLVAIWRSKSGNRFQNYRATFTILDAATVSRAWITRLAQGTDVDKGAPEAWNAWRNTGLYRPLQAHSRTHRTRDEQRPQSPAHMQLLKTLYDYYTNHPEGAYAFEKCARELVRLMDGKATSIDLTRPWRDGGRDAVGKYEIGPPSNPLIVDFAMEAKCWSPEGAGCGVSETSRMISRIRHRQFGIFVTTAHVASQAYQEIIEDGHPVLILAGRDIVDILLKNGVSTIDALHTWLKQLDATAVR